MKVLLLVILLAFAVSVGLTETNDRAGIIEGDAVIGGLFPIHQLSTQNTCSKEIRDAYGIQRLEAMLYAVDQINSMENFLPIKLGAEIRDSCNLEPKALDETLQFVIDAVPSCSSNLSGVKNDKLLGVVGASLSSVTGQVASLLRLFKIPQISYGSTSIDLSDQAKYDYLLRTVPSDYYQARAIADFVVGTLNWTTIYGINSLGNYGVRGMDAFREAAKEANICILDVKQISLRSSDEDIRTILRGFYSEREIRGVVLFCEMQDIRRLLEAAESLNLARHFRWVASDGWGFKHPGQGELAAEGAVSLSFYFPKERTRGFYDYFKSLTPLTVDRKRNPWFAEFWSHSCKRVQEMGTEVRCYGSPEDHNREESKVTWFRLCESYSYELTCLPDDKVPYVIDAVYAFAHALKQLMVDDCKNNMECVRSVKRPVFFKKYLKNVSFDGLSGPVAFGDDVLKGFYDFNLFKDGKFQVVGSWKRGEMEMNAVWEEKGRPEVVTSTCGRECPPGYARLLKKKNSCCWTCIACRRKQFLKGLYECVDCQPGFQPNATLTGCDPMPLRHWSSSWHITISLLASVGLCLTVFVTGVYVKYNHTPLIKASGRELQYILLCGLILSYSLPFVMALHPHPVVCGVARFGTGFCICICYAALLVKTNRIARIFSGTQDPLFITPLWQVVLTSVFILPQTLIGVAGLLTTPPSVSFEYHYEDFTTVRCNASAAELVISIAYNLLLVLICTIYAFLTRKVPENFNEARYIVFVMYTTCAIWLTFLPVFYGANADYRSIAISLNLILNATTILVGLFAFKMYVVLLRPEKNIRANSRVRTKSESSQEKNGIYRANGSRCGDSPSSLPKSVHSLGGFSTLGLPSLKDTDLDPNEAFTISNFGSPSLSSLSVDKSKKITDKRSNGYVTRKVEESYELSRLAIPAIKVQRQSTMC